MAHRKQKQFEDFEAVTVYCPRCKQAMPVRKRLLLVLLDKEIYEYLCSRCGTSVAKKDQPLQPNPMDGPKII